MTQNIRFTKPFPTSSFAKAICVTMDCAIVVSSLGGGFTALKMYKGKYFQFK